MNLNQTLIVSGLWLVLLICNVAAQAQQTDSDAVAAEEVAEGFPPEEIEGLVAPVALYPDALLAQIFMAATYPLDVVQASRWVSENTDLEGEALQQAVAEEGWDPSVQALVFFPDVLGRMNGDLDWTQDLGEAYLGQENETIQAVQKLRTEAYDIGNLESTEQQKVVKEGDTIIVQPAQPDVVYVPTYNAQTVYNEPVQTTTAAASTTTSTSSSTDSLVSFGAGALVGGLLTAAIMWDDDDDYCCGVYYGGRGRYGAPGYWGRPNYWNGGYRRPVNIDGDVNINTGNINSGNRNGKWQHRPEHRGNVGYRSNATKAKYSGTSNRNGINRNSARGHDRGNKGAPQDRDSNRKARNASQQRNAPKARQAAKRDVKLDRPKTQTTRKPTAAKPKAPSRQKSTAAASNAHKGAGAFNQSNHRLDKAASKRGARSRAGGAKGARHRGGGRRGRG
jgi:hypothetical protein